MTYRIGGSIELVHESLVPSIDTPFQHFIYHPYQPILTASLFRQVQRIPQDQLQLLGRLCTDQIRPAVFLDRSGILICGFEMRRCVGGADMRDDEGFHRVKELDMSKDPCGR